MINKSKYLELLEQYSSINAIDILKKYSNHSEAIENDAPAIQEIYSSIGYKNIELFLIMWLNFVIKKSGVKNYPNKEDLKIISQIICNKFHYLRISEVAHIFLDMACGTYGNFYNSLTIIYVIDSFRVYSEKIKSGLPIKKEFSYPTNVMASFIWHELIERRKSIRE